MTFSHAYSHRSSNLYLYIYLIASIAIIGQQKHVTSLDNNTNSKTSNKSLINDIKTPRNAYEIEIPKPIISIKPFDQYDENFSSLQSLSTHHTILRKLDNVTSKAISIENNFAAKGIRGKSMREAVRIAAEQSFMAMKKLYDETEMNFIKKGTYYRY